MNAYEYFKNLREKHERNLNLAIAREAPKEDIKNLTRKVEFFNTALEALKKMEEMKDDLK